ncbi:UrcA family protein [Novosphingobium colocasiae]|uniref:UrcA family protein n=1 Tax=Novosphingobium colocasiae TaxID=1256513 RepID=A0A918PGQ3_9SPHN|nr:UrcA family protein [Novosphingobium colocasiae]GGZ05262.1 hypothetical protein GCM10011614_20210 [Novosphingobium colocasiae]
MTRTFAIATIAAALVAAAAPSFAAEPAGKSIAVSFKDLDLSSAEGQRTLEHRIDKAARSVCGMDDVTTGTRIPSAESRQCYAGVSSRTRTAIAEKVNNARLGG